MSKGLLSEDKQTYGQVDYLRKGSAPLRLDT